MPIFYFHLGCKWNMSLSKVTFLQALMDEVKWLGIQFTLIDVNAEQNRLTGYLS